MARNPQKSLGKQLITAVLVEGGRGEQGESVEEKLCRSKVEII